MLTIDHGRNTPYLKPMRDTKLSPRGLNTPNISVRNCGAIAFFARAPIINYNTSLRDAKDANHMYEAALCLRSIVRVLPHALYNVSKNIVASSLTNSGPMALDLPSPEKSGSDHTSIMIVTTKQKTG